MKKLVVAILLAASIVVLGTAAAKAQSTEDGHPPNCGSSAVIKCGVTDQDMMDSEIQPDAKALYEHLKLSTDLSKAVEGTVTPDGKVIVDGKTVATGAMTFGRIERSGSDKTVTAGGTTFYTHSIRDAKITRTVHAFVFLDKDGKFTGAIIKMCGNPVTATPETPKEEEKPKEDKPSKDDATCVSLKATITQRTTYKLVAKAKTTGEATVESYAFEIRDKDDKVVVEETVETDKTQASITGELEEAGDYSAIVTIKTSAGDKTGKACQASFEVKEDDKPVSEDIEVCRLKDKTWISIDKDKFDEDLHSKDKSDCQEDEPDELPNTGIGGGTSALIALGSIAASVCYYAASRSDLFSRR